MLKEKFEHWCVQLQQLTNVKRWRSLVVLVGDEPWTTQKLEVSLALFLSAQEPSEVQQTQGLVYGDIDSGAYGSQLISVNRKNYSQYLGTEQKVILFSADNSDSNSAYNFDVDAFAALSGTLVAGGLFIFLLSPSQVNKDHHQVSKDCFLQRFLQQLASKNCYLISQEKLELPVLLPLDKADILHENIIDNKQVTTIEPVMNLPYSCITQEQVLAVDAMLKVLSGHRDRPLVLTADRGRGKSSALALAACQMLDNAQQPLKIIITAASQQSLKVFFHQVEQHLPDAKVRGSHVEHPNGCIVFHPIDVMLKEQPAAGIVMVDEAAAIPIYLLQQLLSYYHRLIFATTIHGYEGAGRGFSIKFRQVLQCLMPHWRKMHINEPVRWASDDPLEQFVFASCLLNAELPHYDKGLLAKNNTSIMANNTHGQHSFISQNKFLVELVSIEQLRLNEALLQQVFAVLVTAHYQTSPSDVQLLLNNNAISLFVLKHENNILGVAMLMREGHADAKLIELVRENKRRLRDQFLPQSLLMHCGIKESFNYSYQRVMRIAIHPKLQGQGLGTQFLSGIKQHVLAQGIDFIGASFAGNAILVKFWQQAGFNVARVGFNKDKASGEHSCLVIKALTPNAQPLQQAIAQQFYQQFDYWLTDEFKDLPVTLVWQLLNGNADLRTRAWANDTLLSVNDFISGQRQFSSCVYALHQWLLKHCTEHYAPSVLPLLARVLQKHSIERVCQQYGFTGKKALNQQLISYISAHQTAKK